jgi:hypothetical protein
MCHLPYKDMLMDDKKKEDIFCHTCSSMLNQIALSVDKGKVVGHKYYIENYPKPFVNEIRKQIETSGSKCIKLLDDHH